MTQTFETLSVVEQLDRLRHFGHKALSTWEGDWKIVRLIKYRENAVFEVATEDGGRAVLRIHRDNYHDDATLRSELSWMDSLGSCGLSVPMLIRTRDGDAFVNLEAVDIPSPRQVDLFRWIDARPVAEIDDPILLETIYFDAGRLAAGLHRHSRDWKLPTDFKRPSWDRAGLLGSSSLWGGYHTLPTLTAAEIALLDHASVTAGEELAGLEGRSYGLIHADFVPDNLLYGTEGLRVIDFDDSGFGWYMFELATALFFHQNEPHYLIVKEALLAGYRSVLPLSDEDWNCLPLFLFVRSLTYLGWMCSRSETETAREQAEPMSRLSLILAKQYLEGGR